MIRYPFLEKIENKILFTGDYMNIYIDKENFSNDIAVLDGSEVNTIGVFTFEVFTKEQFESGKNGLQYTLSIPVPINFEYNNEFSKEIKFKFDKEPIKYNVFTLVTGNRFIMNTRVEEGMAQSKKFLDLLHGGKIPNNIGYDEIYQLYLNALKIPNTKLKVQRSLIEIMIAELCRYKKNENIPYRIASNLKDISQYDYTNVRLQKLPALNSVFTGISFERMNESLLSAIKMTKDEVPQVISPIEKTIKY